MIGRKVSVAPRRRRLRVGPSPRRAAAAQTKGTGGISCVVGPGCLRAWTLGQDSHPARQTRRMPSPRTAQDPGLFSRGGSIRCQHHRSSGPYISRLRPSPREAQADWRRHLGEAGEGRTKRGGRAREDSRPAGRLSVCAQHRASRPASVCTKSCRWCTRSCWTSSWWRCRRSARCGLPVHQWMTAGTRRARECV